MTKIKIGYLSITQFIDGKFWLGNTNGEGMEVKEADLEKLLGDWFEENM